MFCPQCKAEYRLGFTRCPDCERELVSALPVAPGESDDDPFCGFWQGDDARVHAELCSVLDEAEIPHKTAHRRDHLFNLSNYAAFQIGVPFSLFEKAENAVKEAFDLDPTDPEAVHILTAPIFRPESRDIIRKLPATLTPCEEENIPVPPAAADEPDWHPEDATVQVWVGKDSSISDMLVASLRENQISCRPQKADGSRQVFVKPDDERQAREIVREIVEAAPPE